MSEKDAMLRIMRLGVGDVRLFRNNVGVAVHADGSRVRYGLCPGSSDLIGWRSLVITPDMVGQRIAAFLAIEAKGERGRPTAEQERFIRAVVEAGGLAGVARNPDQARIIARLPT